MNTLKVGIVGFGFMGQMHFGCWNKIPKVQVVAVCDSNPLMKDSFSQSIGNIPGLPDDISLDQIEIFSDVDTMLSSVKLDAVSITVPSDLHTEFTIKALNAGLHVLCEKPMALSIEDCRQMRQAAKKSGKRLMIAHCIRFWPEYAKTKKIIDSGQYGKVLSAAFQRFSAMPTWTAGNWVLDDTRSGGMIVDLHIHDSDYICYLFGLPQAVLSWAPKQDGNLLPHIHTRYFYDDGKLITAEGSWIMAPSFGFQMAFNIILERATIIYDCTRDPTYKIYTSDGSVLTPSVPVGDGYLHEIIHFAGLITGKKTQEIITLEQSQQALQIVLAECQSIKRQEKIYLK